MIACACKSIVMGLHSSLGPIDPQFGGIAAHGVIEEFERAKKDVQKNPVLGNIWGPILNKYPATFVGECEKSIKWSEQMVSEWLETGMFADRNGPAQGSKAVIKELGDHALTLSHARHISAKRAAEIGLVIDKLEDDKKLQDLVMTVHHASIRTLTATPAFKLIENQNGTAFIQTVAAMIMAAPQQGA
jgi:Serine dehydrogenase proteinase